MDDFYDKTINYLKIFWTLLGLVESLLFFISKLYKAIFFDYFIKASKIVSCIAILIYFSIGVFLIY